MILQYILLTVRRASMVPKTKEVVSYFLLQLYNRRSIQKLIPRIWGPDLSKRIFRKYSKYNTKRFLNDLIDRTNIQS